MLPAAMKPQNQSVPTIPDDAFARLPAGAQFTGEALDIIANLLIANRTILAARLQIHNPTLGRTYSAERQRPERSSCAISVLRQPLRYGANTLGFIEVDIPLDCTRAFETQDILARLARPLARFCRRGEVEQWSLAQFGLQLAFVGGSPALLAFEASIERASLSVLPVLLSGEFGTEKLVSAMAIHRLSERGNGPFVEVNCAEPQGDPAAWFAAAERGTLFLNGIERLSLAHQDRLPLYMRSHLGQWLKGPGAGDVRVMASTSDDLVEAATVSRFSRTLLAEIDMLNLVVPPLRQRRADIEPLIDWTLRRNGIDPASKKSPAMIAQFERYDWPENLVELERAIIRLVTMTESAPITRQDIAALVPWIVHPERAAEPPDQRPLPAMQAPSAPDWAELLLRDNLDALAALHPSLRRALAHVARNYGEALSIGELASLSHASASHLGYLFRTELGMGFKTLQARLRILHAQRLLIERDRLPITELALMLGFSDLSHFEKAFRKQTGVSPSAFRRARPGI